MDIKEISKAMGSLSASLAEATESEMGILVLIKDGHVGVFVGGSENMDSDQTVIRLRRIGLHLNTLADSIASGKTKCDGVAYAMNDQGTVMPLVDSPKKKKPSTGEADISLLA